MLHWYVVISVSYAIAHKPENMLLFQVQSIGDMSSISSLINKANCIIEENSGGRVISAEMALGILKTHLLKLKTYSLPEEMLSDVESVASDTSNLGNLTFTCKYFMNSSS